MNGVFLENEYDANKQIARLLVVLWVFTLVFQILNLAGVFKMAHNFTEVFFVLTIIMLLPIYFLESKDIKSPSMKYYICISAVVAVDVLYIYFTYQMVLLFAIPIILGCRYYSRRMLYFIISISFVGMIFSTIMGCSVGAIDWNVKNIMLSDNNVNGNVVLYTLQYILLPRIMELGIISIIAVVVISKVYTLIIKQQQASNNLLYTQEQVILSFAEIIEVKSGETGQHVKRVSEYCKILAREIGFSREEIEYIRIASMMHDVGKLMMPSEILEKPGKLTNEEYNIIKNHVTVGEKLLHNAKGQIMEYAKIIALEHHERWDGKGYLSMKREEIHKVSRIVAVADVFDALVSDRSYKEGWEPHKAYEKIISESGAHFDPDVVNAFVNTFDEFLFIAEKYKD